MIRLNASLLSLLLMAIASHASGIAGIVDNSGVEGGLIVCVGCDDPALITSLRANESYLVHGLDADPEKVRKAREHVQSEGLYGKVSIDEYDGKHLPYTDGVVNLLIVDQPLEVVGREIERVLAPRGVLLVRSAKITDHRSLVAAPSGLEGWLKFAKPVPETIDDWTHFLYDAAATTASKDTVAHFPEHMQWQAGPVRARHHDTVQGIEAIVSSRGRLFYIVDEAPPSVSGVLPDQWRLVARDAFSGVLLWKKPMGKFGWDAWAAAGGKSNVGRTKNPKQMHRRLVAVGDNVYVTVAYDAPVSRIDGASGEVLNTYEGTESTSELICYDDKLVLKASRGDGSILAVRPDDGEILWQSDGGVSARKLSDVPNVFLCAGGGGVYFLASGGVTALDAETGSLLWQEGAGKDGKEGTEKKVGRNTKMNRVRSGPGRYPSLMYSEDKVVVLRPSGARSDVRAYSSKTGKMLWNVSTGALTFGTRSVLFTARGLIWSYGPGASLVGLYPDTGKVSRTIDLAKAKSTCGGHLRCYPDKATEATFWTTIGGKPQQVVDLQTGENCSMQWLRGGCRIGIIPANGMLYMTPHPCACHSEVKLNGLMGLTPARNAHPECTEERLRKGPAYGRNEETPADSDSQWPMHRQSGARLCSTRTAVPADLAVSWERSFGGVLSQPVVAGGRVFVSSADTHTVHALSGDTGETVWSFTAGGRIDSSPTFYQGRLLFGSADGWVYCVTASEGHLIWRFRAAPSDHRIVSYGQVESLWPVHGSVLILKGRAIVSAGRSSWLDGGIRLFALDPATGKQLATVTDSSMGNHYPGNPTPGMLSDLMVSDGECAYMRCSRIEVAGNTIEVTPDPSQERAGPGVPNSNYEHVLVATDGMLDSEWFHRGGFMLRGSRGQALAADASTVYTVPVFSTWAHSPTFVPGAGNVRLVAKGDNAWTSTTSLRVNSMVLAADHLFVAGPPDIVDPADPWASYEGRKGAKLAVYSKDDGKQMTTLDLPAVPVYDGMSAADQRLFISFEDGTIRCFAGTK